MVSNMNLNGISFQLISYMSSYHIIIHKNRLLFRGVCFLSCPGHYIFFSMYGVFQLATPSGKPYIKGINEAKKGVGWLMIGCSHIIDHV